MTGGSLYHYQPFVPAIDHEELVNDLLWNVRREQGSEAMLRLRCSQGVDVETYVGACVRLETGALPPPPALLPPHALPCRALRRRQQEPSAV